MTAWKPRVAHGVKGQKKKTTQPQFATCSAQLILQSAAEQQRSKANPLSATRARSVGVHSLLEVQPRRKSSRFSPKLALLGTVRSPRGEPETHRGGLLLANELSETETGVSAGSCGRCCRAAWRVWLGTAGWNPTLRCSPLPALRGRGHASTSGFPLGFLLFETGTVGRTEPKGLLY